MNRCLPLLLSLFLLCGCAAQSSSPAPADLPVAANIREEPADGFYDAGNMLEVQTQGALQVYPLQGKQVIGFFSLPDSLLLISDTDCGTELMLLSGDLLLPAASRNLTFSISPEDISIHTSSKEIRLWNSENRQIMILDFLLQETAILDTPRDMIGKPALSMSQNTLYYCTASAVRAQDLSTGISRVLKEIHNPHQSAVNLLLCDTVLQIQTTDSTSQMQYLFLSTQSGQLLQQSQSKWNLSSHDSNFYAKQGTTLLYGDAAGEIQTLHPIYTAPDSWLLADAHQAVTAFHSPEDQTVLDCYDLVSGKRTAALSLDQKLQIQQAETAANSIWLLAHGNDGSVLYQWYTELSPAEDSAQYTDRYYTPQAPDAEGLADCIHYAQSLGEQYGVEILVYKDALSLQPPSHVLEYAHSVPALNRELSLLQEQLSRYPGTILQTLSEKLTGITIAFVDSITGTPASGNTVAVDSVLYWEGYHAYIILASNQNMMPSLHRQLYHLIDTVVVTESIAYDQWDKLNPSDFQYSYGSSTDGSPWLQSGKESFVDIKSMHSPKEDRAGIMAYAMTAGHAALFQSPYLQAKLRQICVGIRDAFGLKEIQAEFLWEQYLNTPVSFEK